MKLQHITQEQCAHCGGQTVKDEVEVSGYFGDGVRGVRQHCNGGVWETRTFVCGSQVRYIPNFGKCEEAGECTRTASYTEAKVKRRALMDKLLLTVGNADVDGEFRDVIRRDLWRRP